MLYRFAFILLLMSTQVMAQVAEPLCGEIFPKGFEVDQAAPKGLKKYKYEKDLFIGMLKLMVAPSSLIDIQKIKNSAQPDSQQASSLKIAFLNLKETVLTPEEKAAYKIFKKDRKSIRADLKHMGFYRNMHKVKNYDACVSYMKSDEGILAKLGEFNRLLRGHEALLSKFQEAIVSDDLKDKEKFFVREGWTIEKEKNLNEIHDLVRRRQPRDVLMVGHSTPDGKLLDSEKNVIPASYFKSLVGSVDNLIIYSCHSQEVREHYDIKSISEGLNYYYVQPKLSAVSVLGTQTPVMAIKALKRVELQSLVKAEQKLCRFEMNQKLPGDLGFFLNGMYLGSASENLTFNCGVLKEENQIEIYSTVMGGHAGQVKLEELKLNEDLIIPLQTYHSKSSGRHIVTKGAFNIKGESL